MQEVVLAIIGIVSTAVATGGAMKLFEWWSQRSKEHRISLLEDRNIVIKEYVTMLGELKGEINILRVRLREVEVKHENCLRDNATLTAEIRQLQIRVAELSTGGGEVMIVTDDDGIVLGWSPEASVLFGWTASEVLGADIAEFVIPEQYKEQHKAAMGRWKKQDRPPRGQPLIFRAQNKRGDQFLIDVSLAGYKSAGRWNLSATIRRRAERFD